MIKVLSLYDSSPRVSNSAIASSKAFMIHTQQGQERLDEENNNNTAKLSGSMTELLGY